MISVSLQEFAATIEQFAHRAHVGLLQYLVHREAVYALVSGIRDCENKQQQCSGCEGSSQATSKAAEGKGWSARGTVVTRGLLPQRWGFHMLAVWRHRPS
jgi:hypothetical protein